MNKIKKTIIIDKELLQRAKKNNVQISSFLNIELRRYLALIELKTTNKQAFKNKGWTCRDFNSILEGK
jgi:hypothetical protein